MLTPEEIEWVNRREERLREESHAEQALADQVLARVLNGVWHTTNSVRFRGILVAGAILPEPPIPDTERWSTSQGPRYYPYVRTLGGVSLFDFREFDPTEYSERYPLSTWKAFVPYCSTWKEAVWIELDIEALGQDFVSGTQLLERWNSIQVGNRIMPLIEAAHIGAVPLSAFKSVFSVRAGTAGLRPIEWRVR
jgi:hypothetical protein